MRRRRLIAAACWLLVGTGCARDTTATLDAGTDAAVEIDAAFVCRWTAPVSPRGACDTSGVLACLHWADSLGGGAVARCTLGGSSALGDCLSASDCAPHNGVCTCGIEPACELGSACVRDGANFHCEPCAPTP